MTHLGVRPRRRMWVLGACAMTLACAGPRTALVVAVASDLAVPAEITDVRATVGGAGCMGGPGCDVVFPLTQPSDLPFSFGLEPGASAAAPVELEIVARDASGAAVVSRTVSTGFVEGQTRLLVVYLERACVGHDACGAGQTCIAGACTDASISPATLPLFSPGHELDGLRDAGMPTDGGEHDAGTDASEPDAADAGPTAPTSCRGLLASAPSGVAQIDPDGAGGAAAFDAWCENQLDGGGWTLLAKVTGASPALGFDGAAWTASDASAAFGSVDEMPTDAVLTPYWTVPITQLRVGDGTIAIAMNVTGSATTLRAAMDVPGGVALSGTRMQWETLTGVTPGTVGCTRSAIGATLTTAATSVRVRVGIVGGVNADCSDATFWMGSGASTITSDPGCTMFTETAGGARVCGSPGARRATPRTLFVYGR